MRTTSGLELAVDAIVGEDYLAAALSFHPSAGVVAAPAGAPAVCVSRHKDSGVGLDLDHLDLASAGEMGTKNGLIMTSSSTSSAEHDAAGVDAVVVAIYPISLRRGVTFCDTTARREHGVQSSTDPPGKQTSRPRLAGSRSGVDLGGGSGEAAITSSTTSPADMLSLSGGSKRNETGGHQGKKKKVAVTHRSPPIQLREDNRVLRGAQGGHRGAPPAQEGSVDRSGGKGGLGFGCGCSAGTGGGGSGDGRSSTAAVCGAADATAALGGAAAPAHGHRNEDTGIKRDVVKTTPVAAPMARLAPSGQHAAGGRPSAASPTASTSVDGDGDGDDNGDDHKTPPRGRAFKWPWAMCSSEVGYNTPSSWRRATHEEYPLRNEDDRQERLGAAAAATAEGGAAAPLASLRTSPASPIAVDGTGVEALEVLTSGGRPQAAAPRTGLSPRTKHWAAAPGSGRRQSDTGRLRRCDDGGLDCDCGVDYGCGLRCGLRCDCGCGLYGLPGRDAIFERYHHIDAYRGVPYRGGATSPASSSSVRAPLSEPPAAARLMWRDPQPPPGGRVVQRRRPMWSTSPLPPSPPQHCRWRHGAPQPPDTQERYQDRRVIDDGRHELNAPARNKGNGEQHEASGGKANREREGHRETDAGVEEAEEVWEGRGGDEEDKAQGKVTAAGMRQRWVMLSAQKLAAVAETDRM
eukprot:g13087.t1